MKKNSTTKSKTKKEMKWGLFMENCYSWHGSPTLNPNLDKDRITIELKLTM